LQDNRADLEEDVDLLGIEYLHAGMGPDPHSPETAAAAEIIAVYAELTPASATFCRKVADCSNFPVRLADSKSAHRKHEQLEQLGQQLRGRIESFGSICSDTT
jgi:hypothetical protein